MNPIHPELPTTSFHHSVNIPRFVPSTISSLEMEHSVLAVEIILNYSFRNKSLLEEALTHSSFSDTVSYERLEFMGDAVLGLAISNHLFLAYPSLDPGQLSLLRAANISTEKLARVAIRRGFHRHVRHNAPSLLDKVLFLFFLVLFCFLICFLVWMRQPSGWSANFTRFIENFWLDGPWSMDISLTSFDPRLTYETCPLVRPVFCFFFFQPVTNE